MRSKVAEPRHRLTRSTRAVLAAMLLAAPALLAPAGATAQEGNDGILRVATDQKLETLNPWYSVTYADYEIFQVQYELLVGFDNALQAAPGFADTWESSTDGMTHTFHIREGMKWSDGQAATCADAEFTYNFAIAAGESEAEYVGSGYLEPYLTNAGFETATCSDPNTFVVTTSFPTTLITQAYVPILPEHIWGEYTPDEIGTLDAEGDFLNEPPVVGSGPYVAVEWERGTFIRMERNPNYWGTAGVPEEILFETFSGQDTMVQALRSGEIDYVRDTGPDQFDALANQPNIRVSEGYANGYTYLSFNTRGNTDGYNASTSALADQKFRDALGFAIDREELVDSVLNGHGVPGTTIVPPYHVNWHVEPTTPRTFDIAEANRRLDAAGYARGTDDRRVDKEGKPIVLRLTWPDSEDHTPDSAFITGWFEQLGIGVESAQTEEGQLVTDLAGPEAGGEADWDFYIWGWGGDPDPQSLLSPFQTEEIASAYNDCFYSNPRYDELFGLQQRATDVNQRKQHLAEMQQLFYDDACTHVLYYDSELHAQRTDKWTGWVNQPPESGTPLFGFGYSGYMALQDATAVPTAGPTTAATAGPAPTGGGTATPAPTAVPGDTSGGGLSTPLLIGLVAAIAAIGGGFLLLRRRTAAAEEE